VIGVLSQKSGPFDIFTPRKVDPHTKAREQAASIQAPWNKLPNDLLEPIFIHLSPKDLARASTMNRAWSVGANAPGLWQPHAQQLRLPAVGSVSELRAACRHALVSEANLLAGRVSGNKTFRHPGRLTALTWSPDGQKVAAASIDGAVRVNTVATGVQSEGVYHGRGAISCIAWSPDNNHIAAASGDGMVQITAVATGLATAQFDCGPGIVHIAWSPGGGQVAAASRDNTVRIVAMATGDETRRIRHDGTVKHFAWSPDGSQLASASNDGTMRVTAVETGTETAEVFHEDRVVCVAWSPDGNLVASASEDGMMRITAVATNTELACVHHNAWVVYVAWNLDGSQIVSASGRGEICITALSSIIANAEATQRYNGMRIHQAAASPDHRHLALIKDEFLSIVATATGKETLRICHSKWYARYTLDHVAWRRNGSQLASATDDGSVHITDFGPRPL
jgi:WD40 repeat protein